jgi:hypothetical protein
LFLLAYLFEPIPHFLNSSSCFVTSKRVIGFHINYGSLNRSVRGVDLTFIHVFIYAEYGIDVHIIETCDALMYSVVVHLASYDIDVVSIHSVTCPSKSVVGDCLVSTTVVNVESDWHLVPPIAFLN